ncbi:6-bladed beta-propeller [Algoriphagus winogradskyi]|uniref:6-bladed beta-propeller protein n=1 Tax=Algoriphagus winogradskyi TaxID=237017 RepID=A0ABY1PCD2_9BACT|nr:6-bladed beta-propeller [Algoriphagus winogradskyi]SMP31320.1 6-bladed beta-propeller protein [Algoriphagus winogradskyi]
MYFRLSLIFILITFFSCKTNSEKVSDESILHVELEESELMNIEKFEILELIPLETNQFNLMGLDLRVRQNEESYYVMDIGTRDAVHQFSSDGKYLGAAASIGEGPGQLLGLQDFQIDNEGNLLVLSSLGDKSTIIKIEDAAELTTVFETDYLAGSFTIPSSGNFLLAGGYNLPIVADRVVLTDSIGIIQSTFLPNDYENEMLPMGERNFYESGENLLYSEIFNNRVYEYSEAGLMPILEIDMGKYSLPDNFWDVDLMVGFSRLQENGFATIKSVFEDDSNYLVNIHIQSKAGSFKKLLLINKETGDSNYWDGTSSEEEVYSDPIAMENGEITFLTYHSVLKKKLEGDLPPNLQEMNYDYPILLTTKIND